MRTGLRKSETLARLVLVAPQAVGLPYDEDTRTDFRDLRQHLLEPRSVLRGAGYGRFLVLLHDVEPVGVSPRVRKLPLLVDTRLVLRVGREAVIRDSQVVVVQLGFLTSHQATTPPIISAYMYSLFSPLVS